MGEPFAGMIALDRPLDDRRFEERVGRGLALPGRGALRTTRTKHASIVQWRTGSPSQYPDPDDGTVFAADARLENRDALAAALNIAGPDRAHISDAALLLASFRRNGEAGIAHAVGAFAFIHWDPAARRLTMGRDCLGQRALYFHMADGVVTFATELGALFSLPHVPREVDEQVMAKYLALNLGETRRSFYRGIERVPSRQIVTIEPGALRCAPYWSPDFDAPAPYKRDEDYIERARELFDTAVARSIADTPEIAVAASGGLDSSAIAATAARLGTAANVTCFTQVAPDGFEIDVSPAKYSDERHKMEALLRMYPGMQIRYFPDDTPHAYELDARRFFSRAQVPVLNPLNLNVAFFYEAIAKGGYKAMLMGNMGNFGLTWDGKFALPVHLKNGHLRAFARDLKARARVRSRGLAETFAADVIQPMLPNFLAPLAWRIADPARSSIARFSALAPRYIEEQGLSEQWMREGYTPWTLLRPTRDPARLRALHLFDTNQPARDMNAAHTRVFGNEMRDPHSDRDLLEFLLKVPEPLYRRGGVARGFSRAVLADRLPPEIVREQRRGAHGFNWFARLSATKADIENELERLSASPLGQKLIDVPRLKQVVANWPEDAQAAQWRKREFAVLLSRAIHTGRFIRWVEGGNG
jgi:asparagine synthase (glutamine-hydrolysing)